MDDYLNINSCANLISKFITEHEKIKYKINFKKFLLVPTIIWPNQEITPQTKNLFPCHRVLTLTRTLFQFHEHRFMTFHPNVLN